MKKIVLASQNKNKVKELQIILNGYEVISLADIGFCDDIDETGSTTMENSKIKALAVLNYVKQNGLDYAVVADDSGLFVNALGGEPGVYSARYAGNHDDAANRKKLLKNLEDKTDRTAYFECVITYADAGVLKQFVGRTYGEITKKELGNGGFGYDSIFYSHDLKKTFGESSAEEKNSVSHRGRALAGFSDWLKKRA